MVFPVPTVLYKECLLVLVEETPHFKCYNHSRPFLMEIYHLFGVEIILCKTIKRK